MWGLFVFVTTISWATAGSYIRSARQQQQANPGWDIRLAVPGNPGDDYPTLGNIPRTSFSCSGKAPGYYADLETNCQAFRVCTSGSTYGFQSFLCPNGTLFNQAVVVCDWWMNVNCQKSQDYINNNNEKYGSLKLGPQLMKDIKKMITHPMRNPYDKTIMKSNLIVMQDYKPPIGMMYTTGSLIASPVRAPNSVYVPAKQIQQPYQNGYRNDNIFAASTPSPTYVPPSYNSGSLSQRDAEVFQRQRQNEQFQRSGRLQSTQTSQISNGHAGQFSQNHNFANSYNKANLISRPSQLYSPAQYRQSNFGNQNYNQREQLRQSGQYNDGRTQSQYRGNQATGFGISFAKQQYNSLPLANNNNGQINTEAKQNLVSEETPATIITKTLTFNRIVDPEPGKPKSRITIKTWIVKPTKSAKLIADPNSYHYPRPTNPPSEKQVAQATGYVYNPPTTQSAKIQSEPSGYSYNRPTTAAKQIEGPYVYNKPTVAAKQVVTTSSRLYLTPTSPPPTLSRLYLNPTTPPPTAPAKLYLPPTTYKPAAKLYLPPSPANVVISRQYLPSNSVPQQQSDKLVASPTSPTPVYAAPNHENPSFTLTKHSHINANHNNLTFADILTKEKLDITVNDIVSDTSKLLNSASPQHFEQYNQDKSVDYSDESYTQSETHEEESGENLTPQSPTVLTKSSRIVAEPSLELEPPLHTLDPNQNIVNTNRLATLPFYKEPNTNTIERTVSLKISIPEKVASYLFKSQNESDYDKLEILNTGSSNYLVLTNNILNKNPAASFIPIGRLIADKNSSISDSQALVFNFLADSLNAAKEYSTIAKQNLAVPASTQFEGVNNQQLARITDQISQLTASQYAHKQNNYHSNIRSQGSPNNYQTAKYTSGYAQNQQHANSAPARLTDQGYVYQSGNNGLNNNPQLSQNQIYSGQLYQLPVPDVTNHIYNAGSNYVQNEQQSVTSHNNLPTHSSAEVEIVPSQTLPIAPAKIQQFTTPNEAETFNSHEHSAQALLGNFLNNDNGISAQLQDKIVGTIPHPLGDNKLVTYKKDQSYYVYTKLNNNAIGNGQVNNAQSSQSAKLIQSNNPNYVFQLVPSVSYQLDDEREQQKILNAFSIDEFGSPKKANLQHANNGHELISDVNYSVEHSQGAKQLEGNEVNTLYAGPSSYSAPQASVGSLETGNQNSNARLELKDHNGYGKVSPARQFGY